MELRWIPALLLLAVAVTPSVSAIHDLLPCDDIPQTCVAQDVLIHHIIVAYETCEETMNEYGQSCDVNTPLVKISIVRSPLHDF